MNFKKGSMKKLITLLILLLLATPVHATQYYIDADAAAGGDGTTTATTGANCAWDTLSDISVSAGDTVSLQRGDTWAEDLFGPGGATSGSEGNPITVNSYGYGNKPVIDRIVVSSGGYNDITIEDIECTATTPNNMAINIKGPNARIIIDGCTVNGNNINTDVIQIQGATGWASDITVQNCIIKDSSAKRNIHILDYAKNVNILNNEIYNAGENNVQVYSSTNNPTISPYAILISGNTIYGSQTAHGVELGAYSEYVTVTNNKIYNNYNEGICLTTGVDNSIVYNNIIYGNKVSLRISGGCSNNKVFNNTMYNSYAAFTRVVYLRTNTGTNNVFKNNIIRSNSASASQLTMENAGGYDFNYNNWYEASGTEKFVWDGNTYTTFAAYQAASGLDTKSINADSLFNSPTDSDFSVSRGSPVWNRGTNLTIFSTDYNGITRGGLLGSKNWEIGAYEIPFGRTTAVGRGWHQ